MLHSLKAKLILAFGSLTLILFLALGVFLVDAKTKELSKDISDSAQGFAAFTVEPVLELYETYLKPGQFLPFKRELLALLSRNENISSVQIFTYNGDILFDSEQEVEGRYEGEDRHLMDSEEMDRVQSNKTSLLLDSHRVVYLNVLPDKTVEVVNFNEKRVPDLKSTEKIVDIMVPTGSTYAVRYRVSYDSMVARLNTDKMQIAVATAVGVFLTLLLATLLSVSITRPLRDLKDAVLQIAGGKFNVRVNTKTKDELGVLGDSFNKMAKDLEASTKAIKYKERVQKELELAKQIQDELLPKAQLSLSKMELSGGLIPATEVGGDAFDYIKMSEHRYLAYLGDVTGHGVPAGIVSSIANALLYSMRDESKLMVITERLNDVLRDKTLNQLFMTLALLIWDDKSSKLSYLSAGHPPALYYSNKTKKVDEIRLKGIALGMVPNVKPLMADKTITMAAGDLFVVYSDGVPEARNKKDEMYGVEKLKALIEKCAKADKSADATKKAIMDGVLGHIAGHEHLDDITVLVLKRKKA